MTVASPRTPPRRTPSASASTWSTTASGTKRANASRACSRSKATVRPWIAPVSSIAGDAGDERVDDGDDRAVVWNSTCEPTRNATTPASADRQRRARPAAAARRAARPAPSDDHQQRRSATRAPRAAGSRRARCWIASAWISGPGISASPVVDVLCWSCSDVAVDADDDDLARARRAGSNVPSQDVGEADAS